MKEARLHYCSSLNSPSVIKPRFATVDMTCITHGLKIHMGKLTGTNRSKHQHFSTVRSGGGFIPLQGNLHVVNKI